MNDNEIELIIKIPTRIYNDMQTLFFIKEADIPIVEAAIHIGKQVPRWIPVSERLPERAGSYLTTMVNEYDSKLSYMMVCGYLDQIWYPDDDAASGDVVAWMPLPKRYKAESEVEDDNK